MGNYNRRLLLIQCKNLAKMISVEDVKEFEASVGRYPRRGTLSIFVSSKKSSSYSFNKGFSPDAIDWAKNSEYDILLTNIFNLQHDIANYKFKNLKEDEKIEKVKEDIISTLDEKFDDMKNEFSFYIKCFYYLIIFLILIIICSFSFNCYLFFK
jgi:hypothetical protein